jgi:hypothetical protein
METQADRDAIADEAVGQKRDSPPPEARRETDNRSLEEVNRISKATGADASIPEKTAESLGERVADAYSDPDLADRPFSIGQGSARRLFNPFDLQRFVTLVTGFALGYLAAVLLDGRIDARLGKAPELFQITKPPQGDRHPRGFVQSAVLKTVTEHPQGMTAAEIIRELGHQGIGQQSITAALDALVDAKKLRGQSTAGKYLSVSAEVPTAPDQPSS